MFEAALYFRFIEWKKITAWKCALEEIKRLQSIDLAQKSLEDKSSKVSKINVISLNTVSLISHIDDIRFDQKFKSADLILLQETSLQSDHSHEEQLAIEGKQSHFNSIGHRKGLAIYFTDNFLQRSAITKQTHQISSVSSSNLCVVNVYRSKQAGYQFNHDLETFISEPGLDYILLGDWNFCCRDETNHSVLLLLQKHSFSMGFDPPIATHNQGRCLDQIYYRFSNNSTTKLIACQISPCYFSDHDAISISIAVNST